MNATAQVNPYQVWVDANPAEFEWITAGCQRGNAFAISLLGGLARYRSLTDGQLNAVRRAITRDAERANPTPATSVAGEGFTKLLEGFAKARASGLKWPKVHVADLTFSAAGANSKNPGSLYIKSGDLYLGKISPQGEFRKSFECTPVQADLVVKVGLDPLAEAVAHGKRTGHCAICSRKLTDPESVDRGIGPVCATKFGW